MQSSNSKPSSPNASLAMKVRTQKITHHQNNYFKDNTEEKKEVTLEKLMQPNFRIENPSSRRQLALNSGPHKKFSSAKNSPSPMGPQFFGPLPVESPKGALLGSGMLLFQAQSSHMCFYYAQTKLRAKGLTARSSASCSDTCRERKSPARRPRDPEAVPVWAAPFKARLTSLTCYR